MLSALEARNGKPNILYVDDEANNLESFVAAFRRVYNVYTATSATEAVKVLRAHEIAVIITDQRMPEMTGVQFLEAIIPEFPNPVRMLMTGYSDSDAVIKAINNGRIFRYITKPWDEAELKQNIDSAVRLYELEQQNVVVLSQRHEKIYQLERILNIFGKYVPKDVVNQALNREQSIEMLFNGEQRIVSILFASINNINEFYDKKDPQQVHDYINRYFSIMSDCIEEHKGIVDKFVGGNILAIFGAPISSIENQKNSVFCALAMIERVRKFNEENAEKLGASIKLNVGIHSGEVVVGNIGSKEYITYTAIGDTVNTTARIIELMQTEPPESIFITDEVNQFVTNSVHTESLGERKIRGRDKSVNLHRIKAKNI